jgi:transglutaminase-like putative cysteine protease
MLASHTGVAIGPLIRAIDHSNAGLKMKSIEICHVTRYGFGVPVQLGLHTLLLRPREGHDLRIASSKLDIKPQATLTWRRDLYDNVVGVAAFNKEPADQLSIVSRVVVELYETMPLNFIVEEHALHFPLSYTPQEQIALRPYLEPVYTDHPRLAVWLEDYRDAPDGSETFSVLDRMNRRIHTDLSYATREEAGVLPPAETLQRGKGSCRDMAALLLESCRQLGIAARFVSGYVHGPASEAGGAASHAWVEVYLPGAGWKGFDPTNASVVGPDHIPVAVHRHPEAIPPVAGSFTGPPNLLPALTVDVRITRLPGSADNTGE